MTMKLFDKYFQPYAEYCLRTTFSEDELKEALAKECPSTSDVLSWKAIKAAMGLSKTIVSCDPDDPLLLLFYGRRWRIFCQWRWGVGKEKMIEPDIEFYLDCVWCYLDGFDRDRFYEESKIFYSKSTTFAEFLEICEEMKKKEAMYQ